VTDVDGHGYRSDEFFLEGSATRYGLAAGTELGWDGRWQVEPVGQAPFKTRLVVMRPTRPSHFNGTVLLVWNNVSGGFDAFGAGDPDGLMEDGYAIVGVTTKRAGVYGVGANPMGLVAWDPDRYGALSITSDDYSFDIFTQAARAVGPGRRVGEVDALAGLDVRHVLAEGGSQSAARLATSVNAIQPIGHAIDGFLLTVYFGTGSSLEVGEAVFNPTDPATRSLVVLAGTHLLRDDLDAPVMVVNSELEAIACHPVRQPDTDRFRWWEVAGTSHSSPDVLAALSARLTRDLGMPIPMSPGMCEVSTQPVSQAALHHLRSWVEGGAPPPIQPRIEFAGDPPEVVRDEDGIACGGIRLPQVEVPVACHSSVTGDADFQSRLMGSSLPFSVDKLRSRYGDRSSYLTRLDEAARAAVAAGVLLPRHAAGRVPPRVFSDLPEG
jgi:hypothetical protein